ncbi:MAG TPA: glycoside hydrolase family 44 protein [bacterium]|nr:glycoside hydrolase family 44 protein [bacterium]
MIKKLMVLWMLVPAAFAADVHFLIMPDEVVGPISPYIYGINDKDPQDTHTTVRRLGGNRMTGYNWENNASNAGSDWHQTSDDWMCAQNLGFKDCDKPGSMAAQFVEQGQKFGMDTLMTIPMAGYVAADKSGEVSDTETAPSKRWKKVEFHKKGAYTLDPNPEDGVVYEDEFVDFLTTKFKKADAGGVRFYDLDNEPGIWASTHPRLHPKKVSYWEMRNKTEDAAENILRVDPSAVILGAVCYGWNEFISLQDAPESKDETMKKQFPTYLDFYLDAIHRMQVAYHKTLVHGLDLHWYPEAQGGGKRITENDISPDSIEARLQAPRSLWDPGYVEKSWITQWSTGGKAIQLIPWVKEKIEKYAPGTKLCFSEYDYGAGDNVSGGLAQADVLGIFAKYGVYLACYWGDLKSYNKAAFQLYRNYDGKDGTFGDTFVSSATEDVALSSCYASTDPKAPGTLWVVALNKSQKDPLHGKFRFQGKETYGSYEAYSFGKDSPEIKLVKQGHVDKDHFDYSLPPLSATIFVCHSN